MSSIKLTADSGGGTFEIKAPSSSGNTRVLTLPDAANGNVLTTTSGSSMRVLEEFCSPCDGSVITLQDGNHTLTGPTGSYDVTNSFADIVGSSFTYTPPSGTTQVVYDFRFTISNDGGRDEPLLSFALYLDSDEVIKYRRVFRAEVPEMEFCVRWGFNIGGSADTTVGRVASWTSAKTIKVQVVRYSSNYPGVLHETNHWGYNGSNDMFNAPTLSVKAIGVAS